MREVSFPAGRKVRRMAEPNRTDPKARVSLTLRIAGRFLNVVTDKSEEEARRIERQLNERLGAMAKINPRLGTGDGRLDAALLIAVDALEEADTAARRIRTLEDELRRARYALAGGEDKPAEPVPDPRYAGMSREEKLGRIRALLEAEKSGTREADE